MSDAKLDTKVPQALLRLAIPRRRHPMLDKDEYEKQQALIDHEKQAIHATKQPNDSLHHSNPKKVVQLITADTAYWNT